MLVNRDFIVFSDDWGRHPFSCMHLMKQFLPENRILWVNTIGMRYPRFTIYDVKRALGKMREWLSDGTANTITLPENLTVIAPAMIPYNNIRFIRDWNRRSVVNRTKAAMETLGFSKPIIVITVPNASDYLGCFGEEVTVYYCVDEFSEWPGVARELVIDMESALLQKVDLVVAVSDKLQQSKKNARSPTMLLTHGVDIQHFSIAALQDSKRGISFLDQLSGPIIGYFGLFDERSDQNILELILKRHPEWNLVVLGRAVVDIENLKKYKNFLHHQPVPYDELPNWAARFDACIIPYVINKLTVNINPLKLKEYLATGKPIVSTPLPEAVKFSEWIRLGNDPEQFVNMLELALDQPINSEMQINIIANEDWKKKAEQFSEWINIK